MCTDKKLSNSKNTIASSNSQIRRFSVSISSTHNLSQTPGYQDGSSISLHEKIALNFKLSKPRFALSSKRAWGFRSYSFFHFRLSDENIYFHINNTHLPTNSRVSSWVFRQEMTYLEKGERFLEASNLRFLFQFFENPTKVTPNHRKGMVRCCMQLTCLTLVCRVIRYHLVQDQRNLKKRMKTTHVTDCSWNLTRLKNFTFSANVYKCFLLKSWVSFFRVGKIIDK